MPKKKGELSIEERLEQSIVAKEEEPYKLPSNWVWTRLGDIVDVKGGKRIPKGEEFSKEKTKNIYLRVTDFKNRGIDFENLKFISDEIAEKINNYRISSKDIYLSIAGTIGKVGIIPQKIDNSFLTENACKLTNINNIDQKFLLNLLESSLIKKEIKTSITSSGQPKLAIFRIENFPIPLPPLEEQKRIVEKLDSLFEKIQKIKEIIEEVKEKTTSRREAILFKAFSGELTEKWRGENHTENARELLVKINDEKLKLWEDECKKAEDEGRKKPAKPKLKTIDEMLVGAEEEPYRLPNNWIWTRLGDITNVVSGGTPSTSKEEYYNGNIPWITPKDLSNYKEKYILNGARNITEEGLKKSSAVLLPINSVLMSSRAPIGYVVINKKEVSTNQGFKSFTPSISYIPEYLYHYLKKSKNYLESIATGTTFKELSGDKAKKIIFPLPPLEEQKEIVRVLDKVFEEENRISELISLENKIEILEKTILDRAFRGELDTGNNDDEPAIELLRRCLEGKR